MNHSKKLTPMTLCAALVTVLTMTGTPPALAHSDRGEQRPQSYAEATIPWTKEEFAGEPYFRHPPGNVRAEDMYALFAGNVILVDRGGKYSTVEGVVHHALKVIYLGAGGRYLFCSYGDTADYLLSDNQWAPTKVKHGKTLSPRLDPAINNDNHNGLSPLYDGTTGQIVHYRNRDRKWHTWDVGHLQERLPRAVWTLCPDFPSAEELGVGVNEAQTAITYDKLIAQDPGRRVLRPDLITIDPTEPAQ